MLMWNNVSDDMLCVDDYEVMTSYFLMILSQMNNIIIFSSVFVVVGYLNKNNKKEKK